MEELDCKGLNCPMPIVRLGQKMKTMNSGDLLRAQADDPAFRADVEAWTEKLGHNLVEFSEEAGVQTVILEKS